MMDKACDFCGDKDVSKIYSIEKTYTPDTEKIVGVALSKPLSINEFRVCRECSNFVESKDIVSLVYRFTKNMTPILQFCIKNGVSESLFSKVATEMITDMVNRVSGK